MNEDRFDTVALTSLPVSPAGYLRVPAKLTKVGIFEYRQPDGKVRRELRPADEVFHAESLDSLRLVPVTHKHPKDGKGLDAVRARGEARGAVGDTVVQDGDFVSATVGIFDADLIKAVASGEQEISCGYKCDLEMTPGVWNDQAYDAVQRNIRYNHIAILPRGRAGSEVALKLDHKEDSVTVIKIGGKDLECSQEVADAFTAFVKEKDGEATQLKADSADRDAQKARADAAESAAKQNQPDVPALVKARVALERQAAEFVSVEKLDGLNDIDVKKAVVAAILPDMKLDGASDGYVQGAFETAIKAKPSKTAEGLNAVRQAGAVREDKKDAYAAMVERQANAWKGKENK